MPFYRNPYLLNFILLVVALTLSVAVGSVFIPPGTIIKLLSGRTTETASAQAGLEAFATILFQVRLPHTVLIALTGASLGASGAAYQGLFRNPLADPYLIGVASGAGLGAVLAMAIQWPSSLLGFYTVPIAAFAGAMLSVALVYFLASARGTSPTTTLILAGVAVGSFATALTSYLMLRSQGELRRAIVWLLGGASQGGWEPVLAITPYILLGLTLLLVSGHALNVLQFGEEQAQQLGLPVARVKFLVIISASLATAAAVAFSGIIGFVGLVIPHLLRILWGPDNRRLIPLSILGGASMLLLSDVVARRALAPQVLPVGVITALIGAPFFLWVLRRAQTQRFW